jgi:hypothetical protein
MDNPKNVTILAILAVLGGVLGVLAAFGVFDDGSAGFISGEVEVLWLLIALLVAFISLLFAYSAWYRQRWAWVFGIVIETLALVAALVAWLGGKNSLLGALISAGIAGAILYLLFTPEVKRALKRK